MFLPEIIYIYIYIHNHVMNNEILITNKTDFSSIITFQIIMLFLLSYIDNKT